MFSLQTKHNHSVTKRTQLTQTQACSYLIDEHCSIWWCDIITSCSWSWYISYCSYTYAYHEHKVISHHHVDHNAQKHHSLPTNIDQLLAEWSRLGVWWRKWFLFWPVRIAHCGLGCWTFPSRIGRIWRQRMFLILSPVFKITGWFSIQHFYPLSAAEWGACVMAVTCCRLCRFLSRRRRVTIMWIIAVIRWSTVTDRWHTFSIYFSNSRLVSSFFYISAKEN